MVMLLLAQGTLAATDQADEDHEQAATLTEAIANMDARLSFRYRFEHVDQDGFDRKAEASTLRTRLTLETAALNDFTFLAQLGNVAVIGSERYNSTRNGLTEFPVVADPDGTELNLLYLRYAPRDAALILGRQRIVRDNQRFIGGVAWRQNEQTFDSFTAGVDWSDWRFDYGYIWEVNRIFGPDAGTPTARFDSNSHILNARFDRWDYADIRAYAYLLDLENAPTLSNSTYGVRITGKRDLAAKRAIQYAAEYARQSDYGENPNDYAASYYLLELGASLDAFTVKAGWEVLGGDAERPGRQFITPLATLHKFQGWADKFLTTPDAGVDDRYIAATAGLFDTRATLVYHDFRAEAGGQNYGTEWDFAIAKTLAKRHKFLIKYANYKAKGFATDTKKWWLQYAISLD